MNVAGFSTSGFGAGSIESLLADANSAGGAREAALGAFSSGNSQRDSNKTNHPCHEGYNPARTSEGSGVAGRSYASQATASRGGVNTSHHHHHHHHTHNPHHALFMSAIASSYPNHMALLGGPSGMQHNTTAGPVQQADALSAAGLCLDQLQQLVGTPSSAQQQQRNAAVAAAMQQQQQQHHHGHSSWDDFFLLNPNLLEAAVANEAALQVAANANHRHHQQQQQHENGCTELATTSTSKPIASRHVSNDSDYGSYATSSATLAASSSSLSASRQAMQQQQEREDVWLDELSLAVPSLSVGPLSGTAVLSRVRERMDDVLTRYIPCVDFLVQCQQELRKGLALATQKHFSFNRRSFMTPKQFFQTYISRLPDNFYVKNRSTMEASALNAAMEGLQKLREEAEKSQSQGCEGIKNTFLGGMKDGESWGLRKWLSRNGNALASCTDIECIQNACQKLDKTAESTRRLAEILRPLAQQTLDRLKNDVPASYQERSTAHPYLPFFHRLEAALRGMAHFDPEDDDVICIDDDDEIEEIKSQAKPVATKTHATSALKRKTEYAVVVEGYGTGIRQSTNEFRDQRALAIADSGDDDDVSSSGESDNGSTIEIVDVKPPAAKKIRTEIPEASTTTDDVAVANLDWTCRVCGQVNRQDAAYCALCGEPSPLEDFLESPVERYLDRYDDPQPQPSSPKKTTGKKRKADSTTVGTGRMPWPVQLDLKGTLLVACTMAENLEHVAEMFEQNQQDAIRPLSAPKSSFWNGSRYGEALRLFGSLLRKPESPHFVERIDDDQLLQAGSPPFSHVIKNPLCFRDIVSALITNVDETHHGLVAGEDGKLRVSGLSGWNMWKGTDLLQAIDLVLLNSLAYGKAVEEGKSSHRAITNKLRRNLWSGIQDIVTEHLGNDVVKRKEYTPTRRSETSGFVVYKIRER